MNNLIIKNANVIFRNFSGREGRYNRAGDRNFAVVIDDPAMAEQLAADGWNVKPRLDRDTGEIVNYYIPGISINFDYSTPPEITYISGDKNIMLTEELLDAGIGGQLDGRGAERFDVIIRPRRYERRDGTTGIKGYVDQMIIVAKRSLFDEYTEENI